jgi:segregation and condensation protein B
MTMHGPDEANTPDDQTPGVATPAAFPVPEDDAIADEPWMPPWLRAASDEQVAEQGEGQAGGQAGEQPEPRSEPGSELAISEVAVDPAAEEARRAIEAVVLAATEPVEARFLAELVELPVARVEALCDELAAYYEATRRGFVLARVAGGYRFQTHPDLSAYVERFVLEGQHVRLSGAALETLAIVAYKQPIARGQVSAIRGVNVETTLQTLIARGYVTDVGRDPGPGLAVLYGTTPSFLERLGLDSIEDLPPLGDFVPDAGIVELLERGLRMPDGLMDEDTDGDGAEAEPDSDDG